jgi:predicted PurR-regulated permease PerM
VVLLFFMLAAGDMFMNKLVKVLPTLHDKKTAVEIARDVQYNLSAFLFTITAINAVLGALVGLAAFLVGLPNPLLWGVLAGLLNFIPYFGPITGVVVLLIAGFITFESPWRALAPALIYFALHATESNIVTPMILGRRLTLNPLVIFISLMFWTWLWGIPGALLSIPLVMMLKVFCDHFKPLAAMGEFLSGGEQPVSNQ